MHLHGRRAGQRSKAYSAAGLGRPARHELPTRSRSCADEQSAGKLAAVWKYSALEEGDQPLIHDLGQVAMDPMTGILEALHAHARDVLGEIGEQ